MKIIADTISALTSVSERSTSDIITEALDMTLAPTPVVVIGVGKSFGVAQLAASVLQTVGVRATAMHATDVIHGGLNMVNDRISATRSTIIALSHSGMTSEVMSAIRTAKRVATCDVIGITSDDTSHLAVESHLALTYDCPVDGSRHGILPSVSTTAQLAWLNVIACRHADRMAYDELTAGHPGGTIGEHRYAGRDYIHHTGNGDITIENRG